MPSFPLSLPYIFSESEGADIGVLSISGCFFPLLLKMKPTLFRSAEAAFRRASSPSASSHLLRRSYSVDSKPERKVAVLGAAGGIGQPLALLMKLNPLVSSLSLYDIAGTPGVAADVSHINTRSQVSRSLPLWSFGLTLLLFGVCLLTEKT